MIDACKAWPLRPYSPPPCHVGMVDRAFHPHPRLDMQLSWSEGTTCTTSPSEKKLPTLGPSVVPHTTRLPSFNAFKTGLFQVSPLSTNPIEREETEVDWTASPIQPECGSEGTGGRKPTQL